MRSIHPILLILLLSFCHRAHSQKTEEYYKDHPVKGLDTPKKALTFFVIGDWGHNGHFEQRDVADRMDEAAAAMLPAFFVSTGDNFYEDGVASVEDPLWRSSFEEVYHGPFLFKPWHAVLGNHDYVGSAQAQVDYSARSQRWQMPARYYSFERGLRDGSGEKALFVFLDTSPFMRGYYGSEEYGKVAGQDTTAQRRWLEETLAASGAKWKIVVGHHPLYTRQQNTEERNNLVRTLEPIFRKHRVDAYFAGHEHQLQHLKPSDGATNQFVSGSGAAAENLGKERQDALFAEAAAGFMCVSVREGQVLVQAVNSKGQVIYSAALEKER